ncbi:flippase [Fulvivirga sp. 29W222]|uniref:Flippase n=1 Tax=Fulvivirga marina TaxID=2494733 RepID=A0A937G088_9BACT|nr:flippase [Fulvivirga marina]MBL6448122.1 flippase [Fulvivirga marina]
MLEPGLTDIAIPMEQPTSHKARFEILLQLIPERFHKYFQNVSWLLFEKVFTLFVAMVVGIYIARYLQPEQYGLLNYAISFVGIFSAFATLGLDQIIVRELAKDMDRKHDLLGTSFILKLGGAFVLLTILCGVLIFVQNDKFTTILIVIIATAEIFKAFEIVNCFFQAKVLSKYVVKVQLFVNLASSLTKIVMVYYQVPLVWFAWVILFTSMMNALGYTYIYKKKEGTMLKWNFSKTLAISLLNEAWPLTLYGIALHTQARIDQVMLGKMLNNYEVGQYSVALKIIEIFGFIPMVVMNTFTPAVTKAKKMSRELYDSRLLNFYRLMFLLFVIVAVPLYFFADQIIIFLYGVEYQVAGVLLSLFAIRLFFTNMGVAKSVFIVNESLFKYSLIATIIGAAINIAVNYWLIPVYASTGAIIATIVSFTISIFVLDFFFANTRRNQKLMFKGIFSFWKLNHIT